jgi:predicted DNA-binding transcriptional regulator AlpA
MATPSTSIDPLTPLATSQPWLICGISRGQWYKLSASGRTPLPSARLGTRRPVYLIAELKAWLQAGAPNRAAWIAMKETCLSSI